LTTSKYYLYYKNLFKSRAEIIEENSNNQVIIEMIENNKTTDYASISDVLGITRDGAKYYINKLKEASIVRREGTNRSGYYETLNDINRPADFMNLDEETKSISISWCRKYFMPSETAFKGMSSYGLKHVFEKDTDIYLSNGQFKGAMLLAGFTPKNITDLNWQFYISKNSPAIYMETKA